MFLEAPGKMKNLLFAIFTITAFFSFSCDSTEPIDRRKLILELEHVSVNEVWLNLFAEFVDVPTPIKLHVNSKYVKEINLTLRDTIIIADSLQPNTTYNFQVFHGTLGSEIVTATTMDTTTQNFTFETVEFGDGFSSSYFKDVWIFDENNIWAVGEVLLDDGYTNIMRWNGTEWLPQRPYHTSSGISGIWAFDTSNIYFSSGAIRKYESGQIIVYSISHLGFTNTQGVHKLWGSSESNIWGVGPWGTIVHYDGNGWAKIDFDRQWYFYNITGNKETGTAYAVARSTGDECIIAEMKNNQAKIIFNSSDFSPQLNSWAIDYYNHKLYLAGADYRSTKIWEFDLLNSVPNVLIDLGGNPIETSIFQIIVNNVNDIYYIGRNYDFGSMIHFNGLRYSGFGNGLQASSNYGDTHSIDNLTISVGYSNNKAYITKIRRN